MAASLEEMSSYTSSSLCSEGNGDNSDIFSCNDGKVVGKIVLKLRSALTSFEYFSDFSALVSVIIADIFLILRSVNVVASCVILYYLL